MRLIDADELTADISSMRVYVGGIDITDPEYKNSILTAICEAPTFNVPKWISTEERMPPANIRVYAAIKGADDARIAWVDDKGRWDDDDSWVYEKIVTHWMPLPELPEVKLCENN